MEQLVNFVIRPPRADYSPMHDLLEQEFTLKRHRYQRKDLEIINDRGHVLQCSHYMPLPMPEDRPLPCVIYCHGNSGCRADASEAAIILLPSYITVFTLDFSGSGLSEGDHVTLGWNEKDDLKAVVNFLRADEHISCIGLWGRSMGAVTSLMYGAEDPSIAGMVLDSPFANLVDLMMELVDVYKIRLPKFTVKVAVQYMRKVIQKKARFDIMDLDVIQIAAKSFIPALFGHATEDLFIQPHHSDLLYNSYAGDKNIIKFEGDHNSPRPQFYYDSITIFFHNVLHPPDDLIEEHASEYIYEYLDVLENLDENGWHDIMSGAGSTPSSTVLAPHQPDEFSADSTEDAINHSRSRWQMSRTEVPVDDIAHDSDKIVDFLQAEDLSGCEMLPSDSFDLKGKENGCTVEGSSYKSYNINESSSDQQNPDAAAVHTNNEVADRPVDSFAQFPLTTADEERMLMEAITASLRDLEIGHAYQDQTSKDKETHSHQTASESASQDAPQGLDKEFVQKSSPSEVNTLLLRDGSPTQHGSPKKVNDTTEEGNADVFTPRSPSVGTSHPWSIKFSQSGQ